MTERLTDFLLRSDDLLELDEDIQWIVEGIISEKALTLFFGRGGVGKTWAALQIGRAVAEGNPIWGLATKQMPAVYIDIENPIPVLKGRLEKIGTSPNLYIWHLGNEHVKPPRLDDNMKLTTGPLKGQLKWELYRMLPNGLLIFDTLRASHKGDENSSKDMSLVMGRLKELRENGFTILLLHHTSKGDEGRYKGSTAISDLCDHAICLEQVREETLGLEGEDFRLGTKDKTRFVPSKIYLTFNDGGFVRAVDPVMSLCGELKALVSQMPESERYQGAIIKKADEERGWERKRTRKVLDAGEGVHWYRPAEKGKYGRVHYILR